MIHEEHTEPAGSLDRFEQRFAAGLTDFAIVLHLHLEEALERCLRRNADG